jgi:hypothetical protein
MTSYNPHDVEHLYCGACHLFLEDEAHRLMAAITEQERYAAEPLGYEYIHELGPGWIGVYRELFGTAALQLGEGIGVHAHYQYPNFSLAVVAAGHLDLTKQPEPFGWYRDLATGRRRPYGNPNNEYVRF